MLKQLRKSLILCFLVLTCQAQNENPRIGQVEDGLLPGAGIIFADSPVQHANILDRMAFYKVPSVSIAVINDGRLEWAKAYGLADVQTGRKATVNTVYQAASISKTFNALCIMKLVEEGRLSLDKDIRGYLKTWTFPDNDFSRGKDITLRQLLSHTAGLNLHGFEGYEKGAALPTLNQMLDGAKPANSETLKPMMAPGTRAEYSGGGTLLTRKILEDNITRDYASYISKTVLVPLGMRHSSFSQPLPDSTKDYAAAYDGSGKVIPGQYHIYPELAPDGLWTTPSDLALMIIAVQHSVQKAPSSFLHAATAAEMLKPVMGSDGAALGTFIINKEGEQYFSHGGGNEGFRCVYYGSITGRTGVVVMTNSDNGAALFTEIVNGISKVYGWNGLYHPETRKLVSLPDSLSDRYTGTFHADEPALTVRIEKRQGKLFLSAHEGNDHFEQLYFTSNTSFFIMSSPGTLAQFNGFDKINVTAGPQRFTLTRVKQ